MPKNYPLEPEYNIYEQNEPRNYKLNYNVDIQDPVNWCEQPP